MGWTTRIGRTLGAAIAVAIVGSAATAASADVLYDNIPGFPSVAAGLNYCSSCGQGLYQVYQPFTLAGDSTVTHTDFAIANLDNGNPDELADGQTIVVSFWNSALTKSLASETLTSSDYTLDTTPSSSLGYAIVEADLSPVGLAAGNYYVSYHSTDMTIPGWEFGQQAYVQTFGVTDSNPGGSFDVPADDLDSFPQNEHGAFDLVGNPGLPAAGGVPEPAAWALMLTGFFGAGAALRRRRAVLAA